jgi:hypothetical protein
VKVSIRVQPNSRRPGIEQLPDGTLKVRVAAQPLEGKANQAVIEALAKHFGVPKSRISIIRGETSRNKLVEAAEAASPKNNMTIGLTHRS